MATNKTDKVLNVPTLRFPGFTEEWQEVQFCDVVNLYRGSSPRPIIEFITHSDEGVNWVKIGDMPTTGRLVTSTSERITLEGSKKSRKVSPGDLILSNSMTFGQPYVMAIEGYIHDGWFVLRDYEEKMDRDFLCNLLISPIIQKQYYRLAAGGVVQNISSDLVNQVRFSLPSIAEQLQISHLLNILDERIALQSKLIDHLKSLMDGIIDKVTAHTQNISIGDCLDCYSSTLQEGETEEQGKYPVYGANGVCGYLDYATISAPAILVVKDGSGVGNVLYTNGDCSVVGTLNYLQPKKGVSAKFLYFVLKRFNFQPYKTGMAIPHIYFKAYSKARIFCPEYEEQSRTAASLFRIEDKIALEERLLSLIQEQKQYLLSAMFI